MLVLTRRLGEVIVVTDEDPKDHPEVWAHGMPDDSTVTITVLEVRSGQVKLGIEAPQRKKIFRMEILERVLDEIRARISRRAGPAPATS